MKTQIRLWSCGVALLANSVFADDIDVYQNANDGANLPNVMFIFDISESMNSPVGDENPGLSKFETLQTTISDLLQESRGRINAGLTVYDSTAHGIQWPVADLEVEAQLIDAAIEPGVSGEDVLNSIISNYSPDGTTATVDALYEATRYFRGEAVWAGGRTHALGHEPRVWEGVASGYQDGNIEAANPATYTPSDAFSSSTTTQPGTTNSCFIYDSGWDGCADYEVTSCDAAVPLTSDTQMVEQCTEWDNSCQTYEPQQVCASWSTQCTSYDITGSECLSETTVCDSYVEQDVCVAYNNECIGVYEEVPQTTTSGGYQKCYYEGNPSESTENEWAGADYVSPIQASCQENYIILLSDGAPSDIDSVSEVESLVGTECADLSNSVFNQAGYDFGNCGPELAEFLATEDQSPAFENSTVNLFTIGFDLNGQGGAESKNYLELLADSGNGSFLVADNAQQLTDAFRGIIDSIAGEQDTFTGLSLEVDSQTASHDDRTYMNVFGVSSSTSWRGNTKGYYLSPEGLRDVNGNLATETVDGVTGFRETATSFWSESADGAVFSSGGVVSKLPVGNRKLLTYTSNSTPNGQSISDASHRLQANNLSLTLDLFGGTLPDQASLVELIDWVQQAPMGDPLHSTPRAIKYNNQRVLFTMTNQGFLHAFDVTAPAGLGDSTGGEELFAFIPQVLLPNLHLHRQNQTGTEHLYGLDGDLSLRHQDTNLDGVVNNGESAILYFGMRRGGSQYFALDVSSIENPKLLWRIDPTNPDFADLGQSWSKPAVVRVNWNGTPKEVLLFAGGYDPASDLENKRTAHAVGNAIYMVDALTGQKLWSTGKQASHSVYAEQMHYAIPSDLRLLDSDFNGLVDRFYVGDLGGQVWRVALDEDNFSANSGAEVSLLATLADGSEENYRKFFYPPAVFLERSNGENFLGVAIASGDRTTPFDTTVQNRMYLMRDGVDLSQYTSEVLKFNEAELDDLTSADETAANDHTVNVGTGWRFDLHAGEKALSPILAFQGELLFNTYSPDASVENALDSCNVVGAVHRTYNVSQRDARSAYLGTTGEDGEVVSAGRFREETAIGIPDAPRIVFPPDGDSADVYVKTEKVLTNTLNVDTVFWHSNSTLD